VALLLDEAGIPRSILEVAAYAGVEAQRQARESMAPLAQQDSIEVSGQLVSSLIRAMAADPAFEGAIRAIVGETLAVTAPPGPDATPGDAHTSATGGRYDEQ
jgi:hypothetical protein